MTLKELCEVIPAASKLRIKERMSDNEGILCIRFDVYDPLEMSEIPELKKLQTRDVLMVRVDRIQPDRLVIVLKKEKEA